MLNIKILWGGCVTKFSNKTKRRSLLLELPNIFESKDVTFILSGKNIEMEFLGSFED